MLGIGITKDDYSNESFVGVLDSHLNASAAYSVRRLSDSSIKCIRVRESGSDNEVDIGFDNNGDIDAAVISNFCGSNDGFVTVWYDASGNSRNASQTDPDLQPKIYDGSIINEGGKPAIKFFENTLAMPTSVWDKGDLSVFTVVKISNGNGIAVQLSPDFITGEWAAFAVGTSYSGGHLGSVLRTLGGQTFDQDTGGYTFGTQVLSTSISDVSTEIVEQYIDGSAVSGNSSIGAAGDDMALGNRRETYVDRPIDGTIQEVIIFSEAKNSTDQGNIESNLNTYYGL